MVQSVLTCLNEFPYSINTAMQGVIILAVKMFSISHLKAFQARPSFKHLHVVV